MSKETNISWGEFTKDTISLSEKISKENDISKIEGIICIARGGLVPSGILSSYLGIRNILCISIQTYSDEKTHNKRSEVHNIPENPKKNKGKGWLIIDDLVDTGSTIEIINKYFPQAKIYTVYTKNHSFTDKIAGSIRTFSGESWIVFPWELPD